MSPRIRVRAPAKVNLSLRVLGLRPDGFHELDTVMMALELADYVTAEGRRGECTLALSGPAAQGVPHDESNLVLRAARALHALAEVRGLHPGGVHLALEKHIPVEAGLGGGSADAAASAYACATLWGLDPDERAVEAALAELGSDCAFFLRARQSGLARCTGRGERVEPMKALALPWCLALLTPDFGCRTAAVYRAFEPGPERSARLPFDPRGLEQGSLAEARARLENDLEPAAERSQPALGRFHAWLEEHAPGAFRLAGSGSSWFGFFPDETSAQALFARLAAAREGRRYALRGQWLLPAHSRGLAALVSNAH